MNGGRSEIGGRAHVYILKSTTRGVGMFIIWAEHRTRIVGEAPWSIVTLTIDGGPYTDRTYYIDCFPGSSTYRILIFGKFSGLKPHYYSEFFIVFISLKTIMSVTCQL